MFHSAARLTSLQGGLGWSRMGPRERCGAFLGMGSAQEVKVSFVT